MTLPIELGWQVQGNTGWGLFGLHLALGLARVGRRVHIPGADLSTIPATLRPALFAMQEEGDTSERRVRFDVWGNHCPRFEEHPNRYRVLLAVFEDSAAIVPDTMNRYDLVIAPSRWVQEMLAAHGVESELWWQGYDDSLFNYRPRRRPEGGPLMVFSGGKLEFRKAQDAVVEIFRRFRETPEGKDAILVTAWQNLWPQTMEGIWSSGYVKGVPALSRHGLDISGWLEVNGIPGDAHIDLGLISQGDLANVLSECDVGIFPNRAEGATNMSMCEALGSGLPCIVGDWTGQADVLMPRLVSWEVSSDTPVTLPCSLYNGMEGWREPRIDDFVERLRADLPKMNREYQARAFAARMGWNGCAGAMDCLLSERAL